jgi:hypothetical protein
MIGKNRYTKKTTTEGSGNETNHINFPLYNSIVGASKIMLLKESNPKTDVTAALDCFIAIPKKEDLNQITDIYLYVEATHDLEKKLKNTLLHAITAIIANQYNDQHITYLTSIIQTDKGNKGAIALDYFLKMGRYHQKYSDLILTIVENQIDFLSRKQRSTATWYLTYLYPKEIRVQKLIQALEQKETITIPLPKAKQNIPQTPKSHKVWWKFW